MAGINDDILFQEERREQILKILESKGRVMTNELIREFNATAATIRRDLALLEKEGLLQRTHGGAIKSNALFHGLALSEKEKLHLDEKMLIVKKAAEMISEGDTIILDSGSTTSLLSKEIRNYKKLTVITNAINIASELAHSDIQVILTGGVLQEESATLIGPLADIVLQRLTADKIFLGVDGIDIENGLTTPNIIEANTSKLMMNISGEKILLVDSSKFGRRCLGVISRVEDIDRIITTKELSAGEMAEYTQKGVEIDIVK